MDQQASLTFPRLRAAARWSCMLMGLALASACTHLDVPRADNYPSSSQQKMRSLHHWDILATDLATQLTPRLPQDLPVNIVFEGDNSVFGKGLRTLLMSRLSERGVVFSTDAAAIRLEIDTQVVRHAMPRPDSSFRFTTLGAGIAVLRELVTHSPISSDTFNANVIGGGIIADAVRMARQGRADGGPTGTELLVSTVLRDNTRALAHTADIYYIEQTDAAMYRQGDLSMKSWGVVKQ